jgi:ATP-binding cassette subfamily B protein
MYLNRVVFQLSVNKYVRLLMQYARSETYGRWLGSYDLDSDKFPQGEIISRVLNDTDSIRELVSSGAFGLLIDLSFVISCLWGFIHIHPFTGFFISGVEVFATFMLLWGSQLMRAKFLELRNAQAKVNRVTANVLGGFSQIYYTKHLGYASEKCETSFEDFLFTQNQVNTLDAGYYAIAESLYPLMLALIILIFPYSHLTEAALIFAIVDLIQRSINPIKEISGKLANIQRALAGIDRIQHFLLQVPEMNFRSQENKNIFKKMSVSLPYFQYPKSENFTLQEIAFEGLPGELIGIVGLSGSGKSTLLNILAANIVAPTADVKLIMIDKEVNYQNLLEYRQEVSIVSQESHIFSESLSFNITLSREQPTDFLEQFKFLQENIPYLKKWGIGPSDKIDPNALSLGQRQLLAGIRACYLKKNIVFFDEISSALDSELELALRNLVLLIQKISLTIIVAHRVETIINADKILVMDKGRVIDSGKHIELIATSIVYQNFMGKLSHSC